MLSAPVHGIPCLHRLFASIYGSPCRYRTSGSVRPVRMVHAWWSVGSMVHWHIVVGAVHIFLTGPAAPSVPSIIHGGLVTPVVTKSAAPSILSMVHGGCGTPCFYNTGSAALYRPSRPGPCPGSVLRVHGALSHWCRGSPYLPYRISGSVRPIHIPKSSMAGGQLNRYGSS